jgi:hypothetical protein
MISFMISVVPPPMGPSRASRHARCPREPHHVAAPPVDLQRLVGSEGP